MFFVEHSLVISTMYLLLLEILVPRAAKCCFLGIRPAWHEPSDGLS